MVVGGAAPALPNERPIAVHAECIQGRHDPLGHAGSGALRIEILDAHQPLAAVKASV